MEKQILGPNQQAWVDMLKANPEKQLTEALGDVHTDMYCCLGMLCKMEYDKDPKHAYRNVGVVIDSFNSLKGYYMETDEEGQEYEDDGEFLSDKIVTMYKFRSREGNFKYGLDMLDYFQEKDIEDLSYNLSSLSDMNDNGYTWTQIAELIEFDPSLVFTEPY